MLASLLGEYHIFRKVLSDELGQSRFASRICSSNEIETIRFGDNAQITPLDLKNSRFELWEHALDRIQPNHNL